MSPLIENITIVTSNILANNHYLYPMATRKYGLIGYPLSHSFSPSYFTSKFEELGLNDIEYKAYPLESLDEFRKLIDTGIHGLNVTIPYKEKVTPFLDELSEASQTIKAVNTIEVVEGKLIGHNTDVIGFEATLLDFLDGQRPNKALVLGTGGAAKAVIYVLQKLGIRYTIVSRRRPYVTYRDLRAEMVDAHKLIINTTPLGMSPKVDSSPKIDYNVIGSEHFLYDLVYNPEKTIFLTRGSANGAKIKNGYDMLIKQAEASWTIWNQP